MSCAEWLGHERTFGGLSGKQECPLSERISGISVYFGNTTSRTTGCRCVVEHCAGHEERCPRRSTNPRVKSNSHNQSRIFHSPVSAQGRNRSDKNHQPNVNMRIVGRAAPKQSGQGVGVEAESRNLSSRRRYCDLLQRQNRLSC